MHACEFVHACEREREREREIYWEQSACVHVFVCMSDKYIAHAQDRKLELKLHP